MEANLRKTINIITLGCAKNRVDSEHIARAVSMGYDVVFDREDFLQTAYHTIIINTCGFILDAKEESIAMILSAARARSEGRIERLYVIGCLSQRYAEELQGEILEVDAFFGARDIQGILDELGASRRMGRELSTPGHYAYLKIAEGCNWGCGYCAIPAIRGEYRSVPMEELVEEARWLAQQGVKELIIIAQDSTYYGIDIYGSRQLAQLLEQLCRVDGVEWIRLQYAYPRQFPRDVIEVMAREPKICKYLDIPFQHISDGVLHSMRRGIDRVGTLELIAELRDRVPGIALRTTLIAGYPTEGEVEYEELKEFVRQVRFERLGVFPYSEEEGTYSALTFGDDVPQEVKEQRVAEIMGIQESISDEISAGRVGELLQVIVDSIEGDYLIGRTQWDSPEVDGEVLIRIPAEVEDAEELIGGFVMVRVVDHTLHDLYAELVL